MRYVIVILAAALCGGCLESFATGVATGAVAITKLAEDAQAGLITSVNELHAQKAEADALIARIEDSATREALEALVDDQTVEALEALGKTNWKDPKVVSGYALALAGLLGVGYQRKKRMDGK